MPDDDRKPGKDAPPDKPASVVPGGMEIKGHAGESEASLLAAKSIGRAVATVAARLPPLAAGRRYILFAGRSKPDLAAWTMFALRCDSTGAALERALATARGLDRPEPGAPVAFERLPERTSGVAGRLAGALPAIADEAIDMVSRLGNLLRSDDVVASTGIIGVDADLAAVTLAGLVPGAPWYPARWPVPFDAAAIRPALQPLLDSRDAAVQALARLDAMRFAPSVADRSADLAGPTEALRDAIEDADRFLRTLGDTDDAGTPRLLRIAAQKTIHDAMHAGDIAVFIDVAGRTGTVYTRKSLWSLFGGLPFFVSSGAIVSFLAVDISGAVLAAGQVPVASGFVRLRDAAMLVNDDGQRFYR